MSCMVLSQNKNTTWFNIFLLTDSALLTHQACARTSVASFAKFMTMTLYCSAVAEPSRTELNQTERKGLVWMFGRKMKTSSQAN